MTIIDLMLFFCFELLSICTNQTNGNDRVNESIHPNDSYVYNRHSDSFKGFGSFKMQSACEI